jgi:hypothetical protein
MAKYLHLEGDCAQRDAHSNLPLNMSDHEMDIERMIRRIFQRPTLRVCKYSFVNSSLYDFLDTSATSSSMFTTAVAKYFCGTHCVYRNDT